MKSNMIPNEQRCWFREIVVRVAWSTLAWFVLGIGAGVCLVPEPTVIGVIAGLLAGVIILTPVGVLMGLIGGRVSETLAGGGLGLAGGAVIALAQGGPMGQTIATGLISGGLAGATFISAFWRLPRLVRRLVRPQPSEHHVKQPVLA